MNLKRFCSVFALSLAGALIVPACSGGDDPDTGTQPNDTGTVTGMDMGTGPTDTGTPPPVDMGTPPPVDMGTPPPPPPPPGGGEGEACRNDPNMPCDDGLICINFSQDGAMNPVLRCLRGCANDGECADSAINNASCSGAILTDGSGLCVGGFAQEGEFANFAGNPPTACAPELVNARSILFGLNDGEIGCVRGCDADMDCTGIGTVCDIDPTNTATDTPSGTCVDRIRGAGSFCSDINGVEACSANVQDNGFLVCYAPGIGFPQGTQPANEGVCGQLCSNGLQGIPETCSTAHNPGGAGECAFGIVFNSTELGFCDDRCSNFPDTCNGGGWINGNDGQSCVQLQTQDGNQDFDLPDLSYCVDRAAPFLEVWDSASGMLPTPQQNCNTSQFSCPEGTNCFPVDGNNAGCVWGCSAVATATASGCGMSTTGTTCNSLADLNVDMTADESGLCQGM